MIKAALVEPTLTSLRRVDFLVKALIYSWDIEKERE